MADAVYKIIELTGTSKTDIEGAVQNAVSRASETLRSLKWFEVVETRGYAVKGKAPGKKANKAVIGAFVVGSVILLLTGIVVFGSGALFKKTIEYILFFEDSVKGLSVGGPVIFMV